MASIEQLIRINVNAYLQEHFRAFALIGISDDGQLLISEWNGDQTVDSLAITQAMHSRYRSRSMPVLVESVVDNKDDDDDNIIV